MNCDISNRDEVIDNYIAVKLSKEEMETFDEHCFNCDTCFRELTLREEMVNLIKVEGKVIFAEYLEKQKAVKRGLLQTLIEKFRRIDWSGQNRLSFAIVVIGVLAILFFFLSENLITPFNNKLPSYQAEMKNSTQQEQLVSKRKDSIKIEQPEPVVELQKQDKVQTIEKYLEKKEPDIKLDMSKAFAANFEPSPYLEEMIADVSRSYSVSVISPKNGAAIKGDIFFQWEITGNDTAYLKILNNRGNELLSFALSANQVLVTEKLDPGLYYWKLESEEDLLYWGKFVVTRND